MTSVFVQVPLFAGLGEPALNLLSAKARPQVFAAREAILREGEPGNRLYILARGSVRIVKGLGQPEEFHLATLQARDFFGEMCMLETLPRAASVVGAEPGELLSLASSAFYELYKTMPDQYGILILNLARDLSRRLRHVDEQFAAKH